MKMGNIEKGDIEASKDLSRLYIELEFLSQTVDKLIDITRNQGKAISTILTEISEKKEE